MNGYRVLAGMLSMLALLLATPVFAAGTVYYYYTDTVHSAVAVTDAQGNVVERTYYAPYGTVLNRDLRDGPGYGGHPEDPETGLVYMQQRYYDPEAGRFLSTDPVQADGNGGSFNRYAYASDNPYRYFDPDGRMQDEDQERSPGCTGSLTAGGCGSVNLSTIIVDNSYRRGNGSSSSSHTQTVSNASGVAAGATAVAGTLEQGSESVLSTIGARLFGVVGMALSLSGDTPLAKDQTSRKEYVIGEGMATRVIPFATSIGADYYHGAPPWIPESNYMNHNRVWINNVMDEHGALINIGPERGREFYPAPTSPYYKMELEQIKLRGYPTIDVNIP